MSEEEIIEAVVEEEIVQEEKPVQAEPETVEELAKSKGWDPAKGNKTPREFLDYYPEMLKNKLEEVTQNQKLLAKKFQEQREADARAYQTKLEEALQQAVDDGDTERHKKLWTEYKSVTEQIDNTKKDELYKESTSDELAIKAFNDRNAVLFQDPKKGERAREIYQELEIDNPGASVQSLLQKTEKQLYAEFVPKKVPKTVSPSPVSAGSGKLSEKDLFPNQRETYNYLKEGGLVKNIEEFVEYAKKELGSDFKLRGDK